MDSILMELRKLHTTHIVERGRCKNNDAIKRRDTKKRQSKDCEQERQMLRKHFLVSLSLTPGVFAESSRCTHAFRLIIFSEVVRRESPNVRHVQARGRPRVRRTCYVSRRIVFFAYLLLVFFSSALYSEVQSPSAGSGCTHDLWMTEKKHLHTHTHTHIHTDTHIYVRARNAHL
ncbi:hypothetical protein EVAR_38774_1 [Eumeta japonica]|uniref:Uncharacterized protein n=1 Tax=Eumeta variegata TaxID=151549 RepID=A0A4C1WKK3_EUMVA|nr:hypothetical protein EVAR_38774_1 [Eumeta japonica]